MKTWFVYYESPRGLSGMSTVDAFTKDEVSSIFLCHRPGYHIELITDR
jgi:hypothetical protein